MDTMTVAGAAASVVGGSGLSTWFIKKMVERTLKGYDESHKEHREKLDRLENELAASRTKVAVLEVAAAEVKPLREEVAQLRERMALAEAKLVAAWATLDKVKANTSDTCGEK